MNCELVRERLSTYVDGKLSEIERFQVDHHLAKCTSCAEEELQLRQVVALLHDVKEVDVPADFRAQLHARLVALPAPARRKPSPVVPIWRRWGVPAAAAAAAAAVVFTQVGTNLKFVATPPAPAQFEPAPPANPTPAAGTPVAVDTTPPASPPEVTVSQPVTETPGSTVTEPPAPTDTTAQPPNPVAASPAQPEVPDTPGGSGRTASETDPRVPAQAAPGSLVEVTHYQKIQMTAVKDADTRVGKLAQEHGARVTDWSSTAANAGGRTLTFSLSVPTEKLNSLQAGLRTLGVELTANAATSQDLTGLYNSRRQALEKALETKDSLEESLKDAALSAEVKTAYNETLATVNKQIEGLTEDLKILRDRTKYHNLMLTIEEARGAFAE